MFQSLISQVTLRFRPILFLGVFLVLLMPYLGLQLAAISGHWNLWAWWGIFISNVALPILDHILGEDCACPTNCQIESLDKSLYYKVLVVMIIPAQMILLFYGAHIFSGTNRFNLFGQIGWILSNGMCSAALAINAGHELIHKMNRAEQVAGSFLLATVCNSGFKIDHIRGHHLYLATPDDVYSAPLNQSIYAYIPNACCRNIFNPWKLEKRRLKSKGHSLFSWRNEIIYGYLTSATLAVIFYLVFGKLGLIFFVAQSAVAWIILHGINYIQHYGLIRQKLNYREYERPAPAHSWDANFWLTDIILLHLPRHPDHHIHPGRCFQALQHVDESPQMPTGYAGMFNLTLIPPLWFKVMNPRVIAYHRTRGNDIINAAVN